MSKLFKKFWAWYERHYTINITIAAILFTLQIVHLYWMTTHVVAQRVLGISFFNPSPFWETIIVLVDYTEIPAIITTTLVYLNAQRKKRNFKNLLFLFFINIQFLHIFWITDEFVESRLTGTIQSTILPVWLAYVAILIDYLELPVIFETINKAIKAIKRKLSKKNHIPS